MHRAFKINEWTFVIVISSLIAFSNCSIAQEVQTMQPHKERPRVIVTSDGEIDDECSMVRFLLYANEWDIEGIVTSSSQYHWQGHNWAGDDWIDPYLEAYSSVYPNLKEHSPDFPSPDYLKSITFLGNVSAQGEMEEITDGSRHIVNVLLDKSNDRPIWIQAWGGTNTIARALKSIEENHPNRMQEVADKIRLYLIWEQDATYQSYIKPNWGKYNIQTIISDQFIALFYHWKKYLPAQEQAVLAAPWMNKNILSNHGPLCDLYKAHDGAKEGFDVGDFRSEGDSPAFLHTIPNGLRSMEFPDWGGWGGRYTLVRENTWLDPVSDPSYSYPEGRWYTSTAWGRSRLRKDIPNDTELTAYLKPIWRWIGTMQNDFAARADWCVSTFEEANHEPQVILQHPNNLTAKKGATINLNASASKDPDGDELNYKWWQYEEADSYKGKIEIEKTNLAKTSFIVPGNLNKGETIHVICEVSDNGIPRLTRYQRIVITGL